MRLTKVTIRNFRSFRSEGAEPSAVIDLSSGVNYFVGTNNVGKSNLLRAVALALDPRAKFDRSVDCPSGLSKGTAVTLEFHTGPNPTSAVKRLLKQTEAHEAMFEGFTAPSLASEGIIRFHVAPREIGGMYQACLTRDPEAHLATGKAVTVFDRDRTIQAFHDVVRFVDIRSGEDLQNLLQRGFKEILSSAMSAELGKEMKRAAEAREAYVDALGKVLRPVAKHVEDRIRRYVRGISEVDLRANVPPVEDAIADAQVFIKDAVLTALDQKGTGVRGAMLLLLLSFIAESAKSAVVFGIEEPEAFLHPDAHRELGTGLDRFTQRDDVTLLVTSHSPFIFRGGPGEGRSRVFHVTKGEDGRSAVKKGSTKDVRADLFGPGELSQLLETLEKVPEHAKLLLVVEGVTDRDYLLQAARHLGVPLDDVLILPRGGAAPAVIEAMALGARYAPGRAVAALFDSDEKGNEAHKLLSDTLSWKKKAAERLYALTVRQWIDEPNIDVEVEDLFTNATLEAFLSEAENDRYCTAKVQRKKAGVWHIGLDGEGKVAFVAWLEEKGTPAMFELWRPVLLHLRALADGTAAKGK